MNEEYLWYKKYRPRSLSEYKFHDPKLKKSVYRFLEEKNIPHLIFSGVQGSGKSALALLLIDQLEIDDTDVLTINGSDENSVDVIRSKIKSFISTFAFGDFKVVHLEEADYISPNGQGALRNMIDDYSDIARFIITCNYENKIIPAIKSRCQHFKFKSGNKDDVTEYVATMLLKEKIKFDLETLDEYVAVGFPDVRKIVNLVQQYSNDGKLVPLSDESVSGDYKFELLEKLSNNDWIGARKVVNQSINDDEWESLFSFLYQNLDKFPKFKSQDKKDMAVIVIADHMNSHVVSSDPEINATSMFIKLSQL